MLSEKAFADEQKKYASELESAKMQSLLENMEAEQKKAETHIQEKPKEPPVQPEKPKEEPINNSILLKLEEEKRIMERLIEEKPKVQPSLPPITKKSELPSLGPLKKAPPMVVDVSKWEEQKEEVTKKIESIAVLAQKEDTLAERKNRLLAQRKKLLEQKKVQREDELKRYNEIKTEEHVKQPEVLKQEPVPQTGESKKRADIYAMMKN